MILALIFLEITKDKLKKGFNFTGDKWDFEHV